MARILGLLLICFTFVGCALTTPKGTQELIEDIHRDKARSNRDESELVGKPLFVRVRAYPRFEDSTVYGRHWILLKIGNDKVDFNSLLNSVND